MAAGILEIAAYGSQDMYLTGVPEITFFQKEKQHTGFYKTTSVNYITNKYTNVTKIDITKACF
jgi:phage portal protein BeeE